MSFGRGGAFAANPNNLGVGHSGSGFVEADGDETIILAVKRPSVQPGGCDGLATVHVSCFDAGNPLALAGDENSKVLLTVAWQSGIGGGEFFVDCTQGTMFTVGGSEVIEIRARLVSSVDGEPLIPWARKRVEANVHWYGSTYGEAMATLPIVALTIGNLNTSAFQRIPPQAKSMIALGNTPASFPGLTAQFSTNDDATGAGIKYSTLNPNANGTPIVAGVEFVRFTATASQLVFGVFELYP